MQEFLHTNDRAVCHFFQQEKRLFFFSLLARTTVFAEHFIEVFFRPLLHFRKFRSQLNKFFLTEGLTLIKTQSSGHPTIDQIDTQYQFIKYNILNLRKIFHKERIRQQIRSSQPLSTIQHFSKIVFHILQKVTFCYLSHLCFQQTSLEIIHFTHHLHTAQSDQTKENIYTQHNSTFCLEFPLSSKTHAENPPSGEERRILKVLKPPPTFRKDGGKRSGPLGIRRRRWR